MARIRITIPHNQNDPAEDLHWAARLRRDIWAHSPAEIDLDSQAHATHRDEQRNAYFQFDTDYEAEVRRVLHDYGYENRVIVSVGETPPGIECMNCGNIAGPILPVVCPTCGFRDIADCPYCNQPIPRQNYVRSEGELFRCPNCKRHVRLHFHDPLFDAYGYYNQPIVVVEPGEVPQQ